MLYFTSSGNLEYHFLKNNYCSLPNIKSENIIWNTNQHMNAGCYVLLLRPDGRLGIYAGSHIEDLREISDCCNTGICW